MKTFILILLAASLSYSQNNPKENHSAKQDTTVSTKTYQQVLISRYQAVSEQIARLQRDQVFLEGAVQSAGLIRQDSIRVAKAVFIGAPPQR